MTNEGKVGIDFEKLACQFKGCGSKQCTAINSPYCFPHTVEAVVKETELFKLDARDVLQCLIDINQRHKLDPKTS